MTYQAWYTQYIDLYKHGLKPRTREEYDRLHRAHIAPALGSCELSSIAPEDVQRVLVAAADRSGQRTAQAVHALIRAVMRRAVRSRLLTWSPCDAIDRPQHSPAPGICLLYTSPSPRDCS